MVEANGDKLLTYEEWVASAEYMSIKDFIELQEDKHDWFDPTMYDPESNGKAVVFDKDGPYEGYALLNEGPNYFFEVEGTWEYVPLTDKAKVDEWLRKIYDWNVWFYEQDMCI